MASKKLRITFFGGTGEVTGANFLVETLDESKNVRLLIDCGLFQGSKMGEDKNRDPFPYDPKSIDAVFVTHAHIDHTGRLPKLAKDGYRGKIYSTPPTKDLSEVMLLDSMGVLAKEAQQEGKPLIYDEKDVAQAISLWEPVRYDQTVEIMEDFSIRFLEAGHALGSAMVDIFYHGKRLVFTGDLGNAPAPLLRSPAKLEGVHYLVIESVYGDRVHEGREERKQKLEDVIEDSMRRRGVLMIPAFSLERTQELLYEIEQMMEAERIPLVPVYVDSPLAIKITDIYKKYDDYFNKDVRYIINSGNEIFQFPQLNFTLHTEESKAISFAPKPKIIIAGSGMSNGGRILHHEKHYLPDRNNTLLLVGYQAAGTLGRRLQDGEKKVRIHGEDISVNAKIVTIRGYSGHMDSEGLLGFVAGSADTLKRIFVTMGEPKSSLFMTQKIRDYLGLHASAPTEGESVELEM